jgi:predicted RNA binding protein YcfA (HicA-like mRNA interferase family)
MPKLRILSGSDVLRIFLNFGFQKMTQKGSHIKLVRYLSDSTKQILTIPNHDELDKGTLKAIYRQALRYVQEQDLKSKFYGE